MARRVYSEITLLRISIAAPSEPDIVVEVGRAEQRVVVNQPQRIFVDGRFQRQHQVVAGVGQVASDDHLFRVENIDQKSDAFADFFAGFLDQFD